MKHWNKFKRTIGLAASFCCVVSLFGGAALGASSPPVVTVLPVIKEGTVTPNRMAQDVDGNIYVSDPHAEGVNVYNSVGKLLRKMKTAKEPGGIALAKNNDLLVTQGTYVAVLDRVTGVQKSTFGNFKYAFAITVDNVDSKSPGPVRTSTGNIFVSDIKNYVIQYFNSSYAPLDVSLGTGHDPVQWQNGVGNQDPTYLNNFVGDSQITWGGGPAFLNRPAGLAVERNTGYLAVTDSLNGKYQFFGQNGDYIAEFGLFSYDSTHAQLMFTYPQAIAFEYVNESLSRAYALDTFQSYVMVVDATSAIVPAIDPLTTTVIPWTWLSDIGQYGHQAGQLIVPTDILIDSKDPINNRLLVTNGFGSVSVYGLASLLPYNVFIDSISNTSMRVNWSVPASAPPSSITAIRVFRSETAGQLGVQVGGDLPAAQTSYTDLGLAQYKRYYYTVRAVVAGAPTTNIDQVSAVTTGVFNLSININGNGSVNGTASCTTGTCVSSQAADSEVTLTATASGTSVFDGWTGDCFTTSNTCIVNMNSAKLVTAFFSKMQAFHVDGAYFDNLQDAYDAAKNGSTIMVLAGTWPSTSSSTEFNTAWQAKNVVIEGGYEATFTTNAGGMSVVTGRTNLNAGKVVMKRFKLKQ